MPVCRWIFNIRSAHQLAVARCGELSENFAAWNIIDLVPQGIKTGESSMPNEELVAFIEGLRARMVAILLQIPWSFANISNGCSPPFRSRRILPPKR